MTRETPRFTGSFAIVTEDTKIGQSKKDDPADVASVDYDSGHKRS